MNKTLLSLSFAAVFFGASFGSAWAEPEPSPVELVVRIVDVDASRGGSLRCAVFDSEEGFPMDPTRAVARDVVQAKAPATCRLRLPSGGRFAVAISHDQNDNEKVDKNFFGVPKEGWAVSNDVRPSMRSPRYTEAAFRVQGPSHQLTVRMGY